MPKLGEIRRPKDVNKNRATSYIWEACETCGVERWTQLKFGKSAHKQCRHCCHWKGGRHLKKDSGYMEVWLYPDDFFYSMAGKDGRVYEHRLIMAKSLGRCLHRWEIIHHKNHIRDDNRIENLQLVSDDRHNQITILENHIRRLEDEIKKLKAKESRTAHLP